MQPVIRESIEEMRVPAEQSELTLVHLSERELPPIHADHKLIQRVLSNLLGNAIKATPPGGTITIDALPTPPGAVTVRVHDTGQGIPPDQLARIFEKFAQVELERGSGRATGTGLGLTFCKMAIEAHGGRLWVESQLGEGSTFSFTLSAMPAELPPVATVAPAPAVQA
jgi:signal transduction histidine kinase